MEFLGIPLEMNEAGWLGSLRVAAVYMAGVVIGSLGSSVIQPDHFLCGASAGVYALVISHLGNKPNVVVKWICNPVGHFQTK